MKKRLLPSLQAMVLMLASSVICAVNVDSLYALPQSQTTRQAQDTKQQDETDEEALATLKGQLVVNSDVVKQVDWDSVTGVLGQLVALRQAKFPENWAKMEVEDRQKWLTAYWETEEGKKIQESNKKKLEERHVQEFQIRRDGKFVIYDVPKNGRYEMRINGQVDVATKTYVLQSVGRFEVGEVDEVDFSKMPLDVLRLVKMGEQASPIKGVDSQGNTISLSDLRGKHVLLAFGLVANPQFELTTKGLKEASESTESAGKLSILTVTVDEDKRQVDAFNQKNGVTWNCLNLGKWDQDTLSSYGLKSVPSLWLIGPDGKVVLTGSQFVFELNRTKFSIAKLVDETIAGRLTIGGEKEDPDKQPTEAKKQ